MREETKRQFEGIIKKLFATNEQSFNTTYIDGYYNTVHTNTYNGRVRPEYANVGMLWKVYQAALTSK